MHLEGHLPPDRSHDTHSHLHDGIIASVSIALLVLMIVLVPYIKHGTVAPEELNSRFQDG